ncbi:MAG: hypothetical protein K2H16_01090 [Prevotella sp.]|nr:hypothetical protein [Prevotella sp.]
MPHDACRHDRDPSHGRPSPFTTRKVTLRHTKGDPPRGDGKPLAVAVYIATIAESALMASIPAISAIPATIPVSP